MTEIFEVKTIAGVKGYRNDSLDFIKNEFNKINKDISIDYICGEDKQMFWILKDRETKKELFSFMASANDHKDVTEKLVKVINDFNKLSYEDRYISGHSVDSI